MPSFSKSLRHHVSKCHPLLHSEPVGRGPIVELLTHSAEHPADILADARDFIEQASSLNFQRVACDTLHLIQLRTLM